MRWTLLLLILLTLNLGLSVASPAEVRAQVPQRGYGGMPPDPTRPANPPKVGPIRNNLPSKVDYSSFMPSVGDQGSQNSCVGWATAYYYKTFQEKKKSNWAINTTNHQFSPAFIYNQLTVGGVGIWPYDALQLMIDKGADTLASFPYNQADYVTQPTAAQLANATNYKAATRTPLWVTNNSLDVLRQQLANGDVFVLDFPIFPDFSNGWANHTYDFTIDHPLGDTTNIYHEVAIVGYDDARAAFRVVNQWSPGWGNNGYAWFTYNFVLTYGVMADAMTNRNQLDFVNYPATSGNVISFSTNRSATATVTVNGTTVATSSGSATSHSLTMTNLPGGKNDATVTVTDASGEFTFASLSLNPVIQVGQGSSYPQSFIDAYNRSGGIATLGQPTDTVKEWLVAGSGIYMQPFRGGSAPGYILHHQGGGADPANIRAFVIPDSLYAAYTSAFLANPSKGPLTSDEFTNPISQRQINFGNGYFTRNGNSWQGASWPTSFTGWKAQYFNNAALMSGPSLLRDEVGSGSGTNALNFSYLAWPVWAAPMPNVGLTFADNWSARWERRYNFSVGTHTFILCGDDGVRLYLDGVMVIDQWKVQGLTCYNYSKAYASAANVLMKIEYYQGSGGLGISFTVDPPTSLVVRLNADRGEQLDADTDGTLSFALKRALDGQEITFANNITNVQVSGKLPNPKTGVRITGSCSPNRQPAITIDGSGIGPLPAASIDGLMLTDRNRIEGIKITKFPGRQIVAGGVGNQLVCVKAAK